MAYASVAVEGGMFPADLLDRIAAGEGEGQRPADFSLAAGRRVTDETQGAFSEIRSYWEAFQYRVKRSSDSTTTLTRENWVIPMLQTLGFENVEFQRAGATVGNESYAISHRAGTTPDATVVHIVALDQRLDVREGRRSPHALVQEYVNRSDSVWAILTNGRQLRLLRDTARLAKPTYLEFNLEAMVEANLYSEFVLLFRLIHASRFPAPGAAGHECLLERYYQQGVEEGGRVREKLRDGVAEALNVLGSAFLAHPESSALRARFESGALDASAYYRQLLRLVYRLLFLMAAEERRLIFPSETPVSDQAIYDKYYSINRLRDRCERPFAEDRYSDLWLGLRQTFTLLREDGLAAKLGLHALNGELFGPAACADLEAAGCTNRALLAAMFRLSTYLDDKVRRRVNYAFLDVEEFGSVYESLLDFHPQVTLAPPAFELVAGSERKQTGSYYTPPELVRELIESALVPVVEERLAAARTTEAKIEALLALRVCDPAAGSGHFLLAAGRRIARELAKVRSGEAEPPPEEYRHALRDIIRHCLYAVDKNPLAVDLCKVALWIEGHNAGLPLSFLDNHVKCGDSLVGVFDLQVLEDGIPDDAYKPLPGDDKVAASLYRNRNKAERLGQLPLEALRSNDTDRLADEFAALSDLVEITPADVHAKESLYEKLRSEAEWLDRRSACDLWTYAFFAPLHRPGADGLHHVPTTSAVREAFKGSRLDAQLRAEANAFSQKHPFFHWPLEFPDVFAKGGFDAVLGNPPWERVKLQEEEFFQARDAHIANAKNAAARKKLIAGLPESNPVLADEWAKATRRAATESAFLRMSGRFPLGGVGDVNTYAVFADLFRQVVNNDGAGALLLLDGLVTGYTYRAFLGHLLATRTLVSFYGFENEDKIFPDVHNETKFGILTMAGARRPVEEPRFTARLRQPEQIRDPSRIYSLTAKQIENINPNTLNLPAFRWATDAEVTAAIHSAAPALIRRRDENEVENPWCLTFHRMFDMANDSGLFLDHADIGPRIVERLGALARLADGREVYPLYEGKMIWHFDHRYGTYQGQTTKQANKGVLPHVGDAEHDDPSFRVQPQYWIEAQRTREVLGDLPRRGWMFAWRDVGISERTFICSFIPETAAGHKAPILASPLDAHAIAALAAVLSSLVVDYDARQRSNQMAYFVIEQLAVLSPTELATYKEWLGTSAQDWLAERVCELSYTNEELSPLARELGIDWHPFRWMPERRMLLKAEIDAAVLHLYRLSRLQAEWLIDSFTVLRKYEERDHREFRTKRLVLEIYDAMAEAIKTARPYQTRLDPPPADPRMAHPAREGVV